MAIKVTIDGRGVVEEGGVSTNSLTINMPVTVSGSVESRSVQKSPITVISESGDATVYTPVTLFRPMNGVGVTASLQTIDTVEVGREYLILKNSGSNPMLVTGSAGITDGNRPWTYEVDSARALRVMAVSGTNGFYWHVLENTTLAI